MADIALQLDEALIERLRTVAQTRGCTMDALVAQLLHELLPPPPPAVHAPDTIGTTATHWNQEEAAFLHDTVRALDEVPVGSPLMPQDATEWDKPEN